MGLVENARRKKCAKHGGEWHRIANEVPATIGSQSPIDLLALDEALQHLEAEDPRKAALVKLRFFAGLSLDEAAAATSVSRATAKRDWIYARAWLYGQLHD